MKYFFGKMKLCCQTFGVHNSFFVSKSKPRLSINQDEALPQVKNSIVFKTNASWNNSSFWIFLGFSILISLCSVYITRDYFMDDALITLRYSYNFAKFGMPIWNRADFENPSMGYTSLLWMAINAIPALFTTNKDVLVFMAKFFSVVPLIGIVVLISREIFSLPISTPLKFLASFIIFSQFGYGLHVNSAMETMLFSCIVLLTVKAYAEGHYQLAYVFGALSFLTRPEGALLVGLLCFWDLINRRIKNALIGGIAFSFLVVGTLSLLYYWYGDVLPNTFYAKQEVLNMEALVRTVFFIATLALPFLIMSMYAAFFLKNEMSGYMFFSAVIYLIYYLTVDPIMNAMSRYQWPCLVLVTYASIPALDFLGANIKRYKIMATVLLLMLITLNVSNALGASYFADATGHAMKNLVVIGKAMGEYRDSDKWLVYHDAGTIVYFSDWNTHETIGLTNRPLVKGQIRLTDIYKNPDAQIVMRNFDLMSEGQQADEIEYTKMLALYGYQHVRDFPILLVTDQRNFVIAVYARDMDFANKVFRDVKMIPSLQPNISYVLYNIIKEIVRGR